MSPVVAALGIGALACATATPPSPPSAGAAPTLPDAMADRLHIEVGTDHLTVGDTTSVRAWAVDDHGRPLDGAPPRLHVEPAEVAAIDDGQLVATGEGLASVWAQLDDLRSDRVAVQVAPGQDTRALQIRARDGLVRVAAGLRTPVRVHARDQDGWPVIPGELRWEVDDPSIAQIVAGEVLGVGQGLTWVRARAGGSWSHRIPVEVTAPNQERIWFDTIQPDQPMVVDEGVDLRFVLRGQQIQGEIGALGGTAAEVDLFDDDTGELVGRFESLEHAWTSWLDTADWQERTYALRIEARWRSFRTRYAPLYVTVQHPDPAARAAPELPRIAGRPIGFHRGWLAVGIDGAPWIAIGSYATIRVLRFDGAGWVGPLGLPADVDAQDDLGALEWVMGMGEPEYRTIGPAGLAVDGQGRPIVLFEAEDRPRSVLWRSPLVARWQADGRHPSGLGGWVLLTQHAAYRDIAYDEPPDASLPHDLGRDHFAFTASLVIDPSTDDPVLATRDVASSRIDIQGWTGAAWAQRAPPFVAGAGGSVHSLRFDSMGRVISVFYASRLDQTARMEHRDGAIPLWVGGHAWFHDDGTVLSLRGGDLVAGHLVGSDFEPQQILDRDPFAVVDRFCARSVGETIFVVWREGPLWRQRLYAAWRATTGGPFVRRALDIGTERDPNTEALDCALSRDGEAFLTYMDTFDVYPGNPPDEAATRVVRLTR